MISDTLDAMIFSNGYVVYPLAIRLLAESKLLVQNGIVKDLKVSDKARNENQILSPIAYIKMGRFFRPKQDF